MRTKISLVAIVVVLLTTPVFGQVKAEIRFDNSEMAYFLVDPVTGERLSYPYDLGIIDKNTHLIGIGRHGGIGGSDILDAYSGEPVPTSYHKRYWMQDLLIGEVGSSKYILDPATGKRQSSRYGYIYYQNGFLIGQHGLKYVLDPLTKRRASKGYQFIHFKDGQLVGEIGTTKERIEIEKR